ncbi:MAG: hypothetical protein JSW10_06405 [Pseudomonadota bacterium]|nr:MAG: hypothetical protein JSW10_06405 [Pseudomonadota bacterium]
MLNGKKIPASGFFRLFVVITLAALASLSGAYAAQDGQVGSTSVGTIVLTVDLNRGLTVAAEQGAGESQISSLADIEITVPGTADGDIVRQQRFCVSGNQGERYRLSAFSDIGGSAPFTVSSEAGHKLEFDVQFNGDLVSPVGEPLRPGVPSRSYAVNNSGVNCNGAVNAELTVVLPAATVRGAPGGRYSGFLTLSVAVE